MILNGCQKKDKPQFSFLSASKTNVDFSNDITENDSVNILEYHYLYNGGGVGIGDFNNDGIIGLPDFNEFRRRFGTTSD